MHQRRRFIDNRKELMQRRMDRLDWNHLKAFLETAEAGSLSAAARKLGLVQSTLSRQVAALEQRLGATLFERVGKSMVLTDAGVALLEHARAMNAAAAELELVASGRSQAVDGVVSVSAADTVAAYLLPPLLPRLQQVAPGLAVEIVTSNAISDLRRREADIAIRHLRPDQPELIGRLVREASAGFYASTQWVRVHGHPRHAGELKGRAFVGSDRAGRYLEHLQRAGLHVQAHDFSAYAENLVTWWALVQAGMGISPMMDEIAARTPGVVRVLDEVPPVRFPIWLVTHRELRTARRIRVVFDFLAEALAAPAAADLQPL
jgi:DNA-binding transcriptional LysR family regulator